MRRTAKHFWPIAALILLASADTPDATTPSPREAAAAAILGETSQVLDNAPTDMVSQLASDILAEGSAEETTEMGIADTSENFKDDQNILSTLSHKTDSYQTLHDQKSEGLNPVSEEETSRRLLAGLSEEALERLSEGRSSEGGSLEGSERLSEGSSEGSQSSDESNTYQLSDVSQQSDKSQLSEEPQQSGEPQLSDEPQQSGEPQLSNGPRESEPQLSNEPQESDEPQSFKEAQESGEPQLSNEPQLQSGGLSLSNEPQLSDDAQLSNEPQHSDVPQLSDESQLSVGPSEPEVSQPQVEPQIALQKVLSSDKESTSADQTTDPLNDALNEVLSSDRPATLSKKSINNDPLNDALQEVLSSERATLVEPTEQPLKTVDHTSSNDVSPIVSTRKAEDSSYTVHVSVNEVPIGKHGSLADNDTAESLNEAVNDKDKDISETADTTDETAETQGGALEVSAPITTTTTTTKKAVGNTKRARRKDHQTHRSLMLMFADWRMLESKIQMEQSPQRFWKQYEPLLRMRGTAEFINHLPEATRREVKGRLARVCGHLEGVKALPVEASDWSIEQRRYKQENNQAQGKTGLVVVLFRTILDIIYGRDALDKALEQAREKHRVIELLKEFGIYQRIPLDKGDELIRELSVVDRSFQGCPFDPFKDGEWPDAHNTRHEEGKEVQEQRNRIVKNFLRRYNLD